MRWPSFSPDGHWLAHGSNLSGRDEVYIRPYPGARSPDAGVDRGRQKSSVLRPPVLTHINLILNWLGELEAKVPTWR